MASEVYFKGCTRPDYEAVVKLGKLSDAWDEREKSERTNVNTFFILCNHSAAMKTIQLTIG